MIRFVGGVHKNMNTSTTDEDKMKISDGYHTFEELYDHRNALWIALCRTLESVPAWRSKQHSDGTSYPGWFLLGLYDKPEDQITYHLPLSEWENTNFAKTLDRAPKFDGHTSSDVLKRLASL